MESLIHQQVHGYSKGHTFLSGSMKLSGVAADCVAAMSDLSGPLLPGRKGFNPYITGYSIPGTDFFALAKTWSDDNAPRKGAVITHTLLIPNAVWRVGDPGRFQEYFREPCTRADVEFSEPIVDSSSASRQRGESATGDDALQFCANVFSDGIRSVVWFDCDIPEDTLWNFVAFTWPALRNKLSFCTFSLQPLAAPESSLSIAFAPREARSRFQKLTHAAFLGGNTKHVNRATEPWLSQLSTHVFQEENADLRLQFDHYKDILDDDPRAVKSLFSLIELSKRAGSAPTAAVGVLDLLESLNTESAAGNQILSEAIENAITEASRATTESALHCLYLIDVRLRRPAFNKVPSNVEADLRTSVATLVAAEPEIAVQLRHNQIVDSEALESSEYWRGFLDGLTELANAGSNKVLSLSGHSELATIAIQHCPEIAKGFMRSAKKDCIEVLPELVGWLRDIHADDDRRRVRRSLLAEIDGDSDESLASELLNDLRPDEVAESLKTLFLSSREFQGESLRDVVKSQIAERYTTETLGWSRANTHWSTGLADVLSACFSRTRAGVTELLNSPDLPPEKKADVWSAYLRGMAVRFPRWLRELAGESLLVVEPFLCEAKHSRQSLDSLSLLFQECDYIPLATSHRSHVLLEHTTGHLHSVVLQRLVESSIREFLKGELSSDQLVSCFNERPFREWIAETRPSEIADLVSAHVNREEWSRCWIALNSLPDHLFARIQPTIPSIIQRLIRSFHSSWTEDTGKHWAHVIGRSLSDKGGDHGLRLASTAIDFCFSRTSLPVGNVVVEAFPAAYKAVVTGRSPSVTDELFSILDWDKAKALRKELIRSFTASAWPPHQLALTANRCDILPKIIKRLQRKWGGEDYIKQMSHELANLDTPEAKSALARLKGVSDDPQYHEYWD